MKIFNTLSGQKEEFTPRDGKKIRMFVCGPTVYDYIHIGNARTFVFFDVVAKYLKNQGYDLDYIQNITDIDDKIIKRAQEKNEDPQKLAREYENYFVKDMKKLDVTSPIYRRATDHIDEVIKQVKTLVKKGYAYKIENGGYYFDLSKFSDYGKLSKRTAEMADDAVSRIDESVNKRNKGDFCLWKFSDTNSSPPPEDFGNSNAPMRMIDGEPAWYSELGWGRPGWHIEDTAITDKYFGPQYDLHGGGQDLIFPHHEAEIAQQESASGLKPFVRYWMHVAFLLNKDKKMSKSLSNFETLHSVIERYSPEAIRFYLLSGHYHSPLDFSENSLKQSQAGVDRICEFIRKLDLVKNKADNEPVNYISSAKENFFEAMDDDFNTPKAMAVVFDLIRSVNIDLADNKIGKNSADEVKEFMKSVNSIFGIIPSQENNIPEEIMKLLKLREGYREEKNWEKADQTRRKMEKSGYKMDDTIYGPLITKK